MKFARLAHMNNFAFWCVMGVVAISLFVPLFVSAQGESSVSLYVPPIQNEQGEDRDTPNPGAPGSGGGGSEMEDIDAPVYTSIEEFIRKVMCPIADVLLIILITLSVIMTLWAAYLYLFSGGKPEAVGAATKALTYVVVGVVIALIAKGFPFIIASAMGRSIVGPGC